MSDELRIQVDYHESGKGLVSIEDLVSLSHEITAMNRNINCLESDKRELVEALEEVLFHCEFLPNELSDRVDTLLQRHKEES